MANFKRDFTTAKKYTVGNLLGGIHIIQSALVAVYDYPPEKIELLSDTEKYGKFGHEYYLGYFSGIEDANKMIVREVGAPIKFFLNAQNHSYIHFVLMDYLNNIDRDKMLQSEHIDLLLSDLKMTDHQLKVELNV